MAPEPNSENSPQDVIRWVDPRTRCTWLIIFTWELMRGRLDPASVTFRAESDPQPVTAGLLGRAPIAKLIAEYRQRHAEEPGALDPKQWTARRGRSLTDEELADVADVYRRAHAAGGWRKEDGNWIVGPVQAVAHVFGVSTSAASKRIRVARDRGLLGESIGSKPGEQVVGTVDVALDDVVSSATGKKGKR